MIVALKDIDFLDFIGVKNNPFKTPLNLAKLYDTLDVYRNDLSGLRSYFKKWRVSISEELEDITVPTVSGWTLTPYLNNKDYVNIKLYIHINKPFDYFYFDAVRWHQFKMHFIQVLAHEFIHFRQAHNTKNLEFKDIHLAYKSTSCESVECERGYHSCVQEIEAYGHCLYLESLWYPCKYKDFKKRFNRTPSYLMLLNVYGGDHTCEVIKAHKRQCLKWKLKYESYTG